MLDYSMFDKFIQNIRYLFLIIILVLLSFFSINYYIINFWWNFIYNWDLKLENKVWLVLWAWIKNNTYPSDILKDRLDVAIESYNKNIISKVIVSGDNSKINHNEPEVMQKYLIEKGVLKSDIFKDHAWFDTYDSIYRAKAIFDVKEMIIFTQEYHLYRALYIWNKLWIKTYWITTDNHKYIHIVSFKSRELFSRIKAFFEVELLKSTPKFLWEKIDIN